MRWAYQSRRWWTWLYVVALLGMCIVITVQAYMGIVLGGSLLVAQPVLRLLQVTLIGSVMGLLVAAAFSGDAGARDPDTRMDPRVRHVTRCKSKLPHWKICGGISP